MTIILFIIVLAVLIASHELGHFVVAKFFKLRVDEFGLGFPPRLFSARRGETLYSLNLIPLGGFVSIFGENPDDESLADSRAMVNRSFGVQAAVLLAGIVANLLLAWILISVALFLGVPAAAEGLPAGLTIDKPALTITSVMPKSPAETAGLRPGDKIISLVAGDGSLANPAVESTQDFIANHGDQKVTLKYLRPGEEQVSSIQLMPLSGVVGDKPAIGIGLDFIGLARAPFPRNVAASFTLTINLIKTIIVGLGQIVVMVVGQGESLFSAVTGPVGLAGLVGDAQTLGLAYLLFFIAFISVNLAIFNLIPFPALDGGRLLFLIIEKIKGSRLPAKVANTVNLIGFSLLILFMIVVTYHDILRLF